MNSPMAEETERLQDREGGERERHRHRRKGEKRHSSRERTRHRRDEKDHRSKRRDKSQSQSQSPRIKHEDEPEEERERHRNRRKREYGYDEEDYYYPIRRRRDRSKSPRPKRERSPSPWGSHQHDIAHDQKHPIPPPKPPKERPNYNLSGLLAAATNTKNGVVLKYHEPPEAKRQKGWRVYVFKQGKEIDVLELGGQSSYLVGRDRAVCSLTIFVLFHPNLVCTLFLLFCWVRARVIYFNLGRRYSH
jgi:smad nuclear-interacting protein 1